MTGCHWMSPEPQTNVLGAVKGWVECHKMCFLGALNLSMATDFYISWMEKLEKIVFFGTCVDDLSWKSWKTDQVCLYDHEKSKAESAVQGSHTSAW